VCTVFLTVGYFLSPPGGIQEDGVSYRALAVVLIWAAAVLANAKKRTAKAFRLAVQQAPCAVLISDQKGRIVFANVQGEALLGYCSRELEGSSVEVLVPERFRANHRDQRQTFVEKLQSRPMGSGRDLVATRKDGSEIPVEIGLTQFRANRRLFVISTLVDVSERKRAEEVISSQNKELQALLNVVSHDLKEPLRAIEGLARLLDERSSPRLDEEGRHLLTRVRKAAARLRTLLQDLLMLSGARHGVAQPKPIDLRQVAEEALDQVRETIINAGARVKVVGNFPRLTVDPTWSREAIFHLVSNALKFTRPGQPADIEIEGFRSSEQAGFVVRDRGPGVAPRDAERIFELFQRAHGRDIEGTGAGLAIVRAVAERHGGRAWVQTRAGGGSEFFVTFASASDAETMVPVDLERIGGAERVRHAGKRDRHTD
jgi:PAS domain S-box-containing protein